MMQTFNYEFEELPLVIANGIEAGLVNGRAEIAYSRDGEWRISPHHSISVEGYLPLTLDERAAGKKPWVYVPAPDALATMIRLRLENEWEGKIQDAVAEQIAEDCECAADNYADMKREELMLEGIR